MQAHEREQMEKLQLHQQQEQQHQLDMQQQQQMAVVAHEYEKTSAAQRLWIRFGFGALCCSCCADWALAHCCNDERTDAPTAKAPAPVRTQAVTKPGGQHAGVTLAKLAAQFI